jgi:hypothetical protein
MKFVKAILTLSFAIVALAAPTPDGMSYLYQCVEYV